MQKNRKAQQSATPKVEWTNIEVDLAEGEVTLKHRQIVQVAQALTFMIENMTIPQWEIIQKIGKCRRVVQEIQDDIQLYEQQLVAKYAERDESGNYVKDDKGGFKVVSPEYASERLEFALKKATIKLPLWTNRELMFVNGQKVNGIDATAGIFDSMQYIIKD